MGDEPKDIVPGFDELKQMDYINQIIKEVIALIDIGLLNRKLTLSLYIISRHSESMGPLYKLFLV